jgi:serine/threonine protein kinase
MTSVFHEAAQTSDFWSRTDQDTAQPELFLLEGTFELDRLSGMILRQLKLSSSQLFLVRTGEVPDTEIVEASATISWMTIEPQSIRGKSGFSLKYGDCSETFLSEDPRQVKEWIATLKLSCICPDFTADFDLLDLLGQGSLSEVYLATERTTGQQYAVKIIEKAKLTSMNHLKGITREVAILRKLQHPNIVKLERVYEEGERVYIVLEHIEGCSILAKLGRGSLIEEGQALAIIQRILEVLEYLESQHIVHRDIKPENVLLSDDGRVTLVDFGLAIEVHDDTQQTCGSPGYVAPEILCKRGCSTKADVFSAGALLYVMLSGHMPFGSKDRRSVIERNRCGLVSFPKDYWSHISHSTIEVVIEMMTVDTWARPNASEVLQSLVSPSTGPSSPFVDSFMSESPPVFSLYALEPRHPSSSPKRKFMRTLSMKSGSTLNDP